MGFVACFRALLLNQNIWIYIMGDVVKSHSEHLHLDHFDMY